LPSSAIKSATLAAALSVKLIGSGISVSMFSATASTAQSPVPIEADTTLTTSTRFETSTTSLGRIERRSNQDPLLAASNSPSLDLTKPVPEKVNSTLTSSEESPSTAGTSPAAASGKKAEAMVMEQKTPTI
jgi:hypothetical protein